MSTKHPLLQALDACGIDTSRATEIHVEMISGKPAKVRMTVVALPPKDDQGAIVFEEQEYEVKRVR